MGAGKTVPEGWGEPCAERGRLTSVPEPYLFLKKSSNGLVSRCED